MRAVKAELLPPAPQVAAHGGFPPVQQVGKKSVQDFLAIRKAMGLSVDPAQKLYNTNRFNGYTMKKAGK